jgi:hypothetical protein
MHSKIEFPSDPTVTQSFLRAFSKQKQVGQLTDAQKQLNRQQIKLSQLLKQMSCCRFRGHHPKLTPPDFQSRWG